MISTSVQDDSFDAVLSIAVIHHIATTERRVRALRELARVSKFTITTQISWSFGLKSRLSQFFRFLFRMYGYISL